MNNVKYFLYAGICFSILIHGAVFFSFSHMGKAPFMKKEYKPSVLVPVTMQKKKKPVTVKKVKPLPEKVKKKKKIVRITKKTKVNPAPVSHKRTAKKVPKAEVIKPVFGVTKKTVEKAAVQTGVGVRVGNTLMKEQEEEYTPPEKVRDYITIPVFDLTTMPSFKVRVTPEFPDALKEMEIEGEVYLSASIDDLGVVKEVNILKSDHVLFADAAVKALMASRFVPATQNGEPVGTILEDLVYSFVLDE